MLTGVLRIQQVNEGPQTLFVLPRDCRPQARIIFFTMQSTEVRRIDVTAEGAVIWMKDGVHQDSRLALDGVWFQVGNDTGPPEPLYVPHRQEPLTVSSQFQRFASDWSPPTVTRVGRLCLLSGTLSGASSTQLQGLIASAPTWCRPTNSSLFTIGLAGSNLAVVQANGDGTVEYYSGRASAQYFSLDGLLFPASNTWGSVIPPLYSFVTPGAPFRSLEYTVQEDFCVLSGGYDVPLGASESIHWADLPEDCRPLDGTIMFQLDIGGQSARIDIDPRGYVNNVRQARKPDGSISFDGISFFRSTGTRLGEFGSGVQPYNHGWRYPSFRLIEQMCVLSGLLLSVSSRGSQVLLLPKNCRPENRTMFQVSAWESSREIEILPTGQMLWTAANFDPNWIPLDGIKFMAQT